MNLRDRRRGILKAAESSHILPNEYQEVEWIESNGGQMINTAVLDTNRANLPKYQLEADVAIPVANSSSAIIMSKGQQPGCWVGNVMSGTAVGLGSVEGQYLTGIDITSRNNYKLFWTGSGSDITATVQCGAQTVSKTVAITIDATSPFTFFSDAAQDFSAKCRIYRAKVKQNGTDIRDIIPCYRKSDSVIGMYDIVNDTFYTNSGTGTFTKGSDV